MISLTNSFKSNSSCNKLLTYENCYNQYKHEYCNDEDFSIKSDDISAEIDDLIDEYENNHRLSSSDFLDQIEVDHTTHRQYNRKFSDVQKKNFGLSELDLKLINEEEEVLKDEDYILTTNENNKRMPEKSGSLVSSTNDLLSQGSAFRMSASRRHTNQSYVEEERFIVERFESQNNGRDTIDINRSIEVKTIISNKPMGKNNNKYSFTS